MSVRKFNPGTYECNGMYCRGCDECETAISIPIDERSCERKRDDHVEAALRAQARDDETRAYRRAGGFLL